MVATNLVIIAICFLTLSLHTGQSQKRVNFDAMLDLLFDDDKEDKNDTNYANPVEDESIELHGTSCGVGKECVPRALCKPDGTVKEFGEIMVDLRGDFGDPCTYLETCCNVQQKLTQPPPELLTPHAQANGCGVRNANGIVFKITGAQNGEAEFAEFPWMVAILQVQHEAPVLPPITTYVCGGSLLAPNVVLTAAHCVVNQSLAALRARAGEWDTQTLQEPLPHQEVRIAEIITHEDYSPITIFNDIALLILAEPFTSAANVQPICLPTINMANFDHSRCFATGWGKDKYGKEWQYQAILKKIELPVVPHATCQRNLRRTRLSRFFRLDSSFMCAGGEKGKDTCTGDGGSPLICPDPQHHGRFFQAGIVSWGIQCGMENVPGVYTNVPHLRNWIGEKLAAKGIDAKYFTV